VPTARGSEGRSGRKRSAILDAARTLFLDRGFDAVTMDDVAATAGASKVTVYKHFSDKRNLFVGVVTAAIDEAEIGTHDLVAALGATEDLPGDLTAFARQHIVDVTRPHLIRMRRMIIGEFRRFPELAAAWHRAGPERAHASLGEQLRRLADRGLLRVPDPVLAAQHLNYLILAIPVNEAMFTGGDFPAGSRRLRRLADEAVRVFLAGYAPGRSD
jgi:TetR/AcrR family transcriptional repressor of mexJK operon